MQQENTTQTSKSKYSDAELNEFKELITEKDKNGT